MIMPFRVSGRGGVKTSVIFEIIFTLIYKLNVCLQDFGPNRQKSVPYDLRKLSKTVDFQIEKPTGGATTLKKLKVHAQGTK